MQTITLLVMKLVDSRWQNDKACLFTCREFVPDVVSASIGPQPTRQAAHMFTLDSCWQKKMAQKC